MEIEIGKGLSAIRFGDRLSDSLHRLGEPDAVGHAECGDPRPVWNRFRLALWFRRDRLHWLVCGRPDATLLGRPVVGRPLEEVVSLLEEGMGAPTERRRYGSLDSCCFDRQELELQVEFGVVETVRFGHLSDEDDSPLWPTASGGTGEIGSVDPPRILASDFLDGTPPKIEIGCGLGEIRFGWTEAELVAALGPPDHIEHDAPLSPRLRYDRLRCGFTIDAEDERLTEIDCAHPDTRLPGGGRIGDPLRELVAALGGERASEIDGGEFEHWDVDVDQLELFGAFGRLDRIRFGPRYDAAGEIRWP